MWTLVQATSLVVCQAPPDVRLGYLNLYTTEMAVSRCAALDTCLKAGNCFWRSRAVRPCRRQPCATQESGTVQFSHAGLPILLATCGRRILVSNYYFVYMGCSALGWKSLYLSWLW